MVGRNIPLLLNKRFNLGAVVAREYGLPSLIAVANATDVFSTGDSVELNADLGTISKITEQH